MPQIIQPLTPTPFSNLYMDVGSVNFDPTLQGSSRGILTHSDATPHLITITDADDVPVSSFTIEPNSDVIFQKRTTDKVTSDFHPSPETYKLTAHGIGYRDNSYPADTIKLLDTEITMGSWTGNDSTYANTFVGYSLVRVFNNSANPIRVRCYEEINIGFYGPSHTFGDRDSNGELNSGNWQMVIRPESSLVLMKKPWQLLRGFGAVTLGVPVAF